MDYKCINCERLLTIPYRSEYANEDIECSSCQAKQGIEVYDKCRKCGAYYLKNFMECPDCYYRVALPELKYTYITSEAEYIEAIEFLNESDLIGLDTEGNSLSPFNNDLLLIQLGNESHVYIFDFTWHNRLKHEQFWQSNDVTFVIHNAKFDYKIIKYSLGIEITNVYDTYLAERILTCGIERKNGLKDVSKKYIGLEMDKEVRDDFITMTYENFSKRVSQKYLEYAAKDVQVLIPIYQMQSRLLSVQRLSNIAYLEFEVSKIVADMELRGIYVNTNEWEKIVQDCAIKKKDTEKDILALLKESRIVDKTALFLTLNLNSTMVLKDIFSRLGIHLKSTGDDDLAQITHPLAGLLREYRKYEKQLSSFGKNFLKLVRSETSRIHPSFNQIGADTGRFSCNEPNLQQIPATAEYRKCFCSPPGRKIIACDYSQQELRVLASLSGDPKFIKFYEDGVDLHTATASMMFNIPHEKVEKETHRRIAKTINFGLAYGQGAKKLGVTIGVSEEEATKMIDKYFSQFTFIRDWLNQAAEDAKKKGFSVTLLGRKRYYKLPSEDDPEYKQTLSSIGRQGKNTPIQGSSADMVKLALKSIAERLKEANLDAFLINVVHDEIVVEASEKDAEAAAKIVKNAMEEAGRRLAPNVPIVAEYGIGDWWAH